MCKTIVILFFTKVRQKMHIRKKRAFENDKIIYQLYLSKGQNELVHNWTLGWCSKEGEKPYFQMRARAYRLHHANVATGELALLGGECA